MVLCMPYNGVMTRSHKAMFIFGHCVGKINTEVEGSHSEIVCSALYHHIEDTITGSLIQS